LINSVVGNHKTTKTAVSNCWFINKSKIGKVDFLFQEFHFHLYSIIVSNSWYLLSTCTLQCTNYGC